MIFSANIRLAPAPDRRLAVPKSLPLRAHPRIAHDHFRSPFRSRHLHRESPCKSGLRVLCITSKFRTLAEESLGCPAFNSRSCFCDERCSMRRKILFCSQGDFPRWHEANLHPLCLKLALYRADCYSPREDRDPCSGLGDCSGLWG